MRRAPLVLGALVVLTSGVGAQENATLRRAKALYDDLDYAGAIVAARSALQESLNQQDQVLGYELLAYAYGAVDSTRKAVEAFRQLIFLDPNREPDVERVSPRITSLYASALGQVLVVRHLQIDSSTFVAGQGGALVQFEVSRASVTRTRVVGPGVDMVVDTQTVSGGVRSSFRWTAAGADGAPLPAGRYQMITTAGEGDQNEFSSPPLAVDVARADRDTLVHLTSLPGYREQPELVRPARDYRPLLLSLLYTGAGAGGFLAIQNSGLGTGPRTALISVSAAAVGTGLFLSLRQAESRPSPQNILYNQLLRELLAKQNAEVARENAQRRSEVVITVRPGT
jgi:hypothetical protein